MIIQPPRRIDKGKARLYNELSARMYANNDGGNHMKTCPKCGHYMVEKRTGRDTMVHLCANENCRYKEIVTVAKEQEEDE